MAMKYPEWYKVPWENQAAFDQATDETVAAWQEKCKALDARWKEEYAPTVKRVQEAVTTFKSLYGESSNIYRYLTNRRTRPEYLATDRMWLGFTWASDHRKRYLEENSRQAQLLRQEKERQEREQVWEQKIAAIAEKYKLNTTDVDEMLEELESQHKYLGLYIGAFQTRSYWGDGIGPAERALSQFEARKDLTLEDRIIIQEWRYVVGVDPDEDGDYYHVEDGRVFRDMEFGYNDLESRLPEGLAEDVRILIHSLD